MPKTNFAGRRIGRLIDNSPAFKKTDLRFAAENEDLRAVARRYRDNCRILRRERDHLQAKAERLEAEKKVLEGQIIEAYSTLKAYLDGRSDIDDLQDAIRSYETDHKSRPAAS